MAETPTSAAPLPEPATVHHGVPDSRGNAITPWAWIPTVNFAQGLQYVVVTQTFAIILFTMGVESGPAAFAAALLGWPWTIKPLWGPLIDRYWTKRNWTIYMQLIVGVCFSLTCLSLQSPLFFYLSLGPLLLLAFAAASHDIACDGYYMLALSERQQAFFVGIRSTAFRCAMLAATGIFPIMAGYIQDHTGLRPVGIEVVTVAQADWKPGDPATYDELGDREKLASQATGPLEILMEPQRLFIKAGETGDFTIRLAEAPDQGTTTVVTLRFAQGESSTAVSKNAQNRLEFGPETWDDPVTVTVKTDAKLKASAATEIRASAGNIALSWSLVVGLAAVMFLGFFGWHWIVLPMPFADAQSTANSKPFYVPLGWLLVVIAPPAVAIIGGFFALGYAREFALQAAQSAYFHATELTSLQTKGFDFAFAVLRWVVIAAGVVGVLLIAPVREKLKAVAQQASDHSGIGFAEVFSSFFAKPGMWIILGFLLTFRLGEVQLTAVKGFFMLAGVDPENPNGGLGLSLTESGWLNGFTWTIALLMGGLLGGLTISTFGLKRAFWPMVLAVHVPNLLYYYMAAHLPVAMGSMPVNLGTWPLLGSMAFVLDYRLLLIHAFVGIESFGYGFGFAAYLFFMIYVSQGPYKTAHYALCTGFMALGAMIPGLWSGFLQELIGYSWFFLWVMVACLPGLLFIPFLPLDPEFGMKKKAKP